MKLRKLALTLPVALGLSLGQALGSEDYRPNREQEALVALSEPRYIDPEEALFRGNLVYNISGSGEPAQERVEPDAKRIHNPFFYDVKQELREFLDAYRGSLDIETDRVNLGTNEGTLENLYLERGELEATIDASKKYIADLENSIRNLGWAINGTNKKMEEIQRQKHPDWNEYDHYQMVAHEQTAQHERLKEEKTRFENEYDDKGYENRHGALRDEINSLEKDAEAVRNNIGETEERLRSNNKWDLLKNGDRTKMPYIDPIDRILFNLLIYGLREEFEDGIKAWIKKGAEDGSYTKERADEEMERIRREYNLREGDGIKASIKRLKDVNIPRGLPDRPYKDGLEKLDIIRRGCN